MTSLKQLLAANMKKHRRLLGISQAALAARVNTSTHYIAMIELGRKAPSFDMLERIAAGLEIDAPALFSMETIPAASITALHEALLTDIAALITARLDALRPTPPTPGEGSGHQSA
jgi:transcriptional regulator with XRE-family HTH domain